MDGGFGPRGRLEYLQLRSEKPYFLPISSCLGWEVPDLYSDTAITLEKEYDRDPHCRFGPETWKVYEEDVLMDKIKDAIDNGTEDESEDEENDSNTHPALCDGLTARSPSVKVPIFVLSISTQVDTLLLQAQYEILSGTIEDAHAIDRLDTYVDQLFLDWAPTAKWFLDTRITESNRFMEEILRSYG